MDEYFPPEENGEHPEVFANVLAKMPECPLSQIAALDEKCFNGQSAYASYSRSQVTKSYNFYYTELFSNDAIRMVIIPLPY